MHEQRAPEVGDVFGEAHPACPVGRDPGEHGPVDEHEAGAPGLDRIGGVQVEAVCALGLEPGQVRVHPVAELGRLPLPCRGQVGEQAPDGARDPDAVGEQRHVVHVQPAAPDQGHDLVHAVPHAPRREVHEGAAVEAANRERAVGRAEDRPPVGVREVDVERRALAAGRDLARTRHRADHERAARRPGGVALGSRGALGAGLAAERGEQQPQGGPARRAYGYFRTRRETYTRVSRSQSSGRSPVVHSHVRDWPGSRGSRNSS